MAKTRSLGSPSEALTRAELSDAERRTVLRLVDSLREDLGADLRAVWLYGSRARGEGVHAESDVDLIVIADGGERRHGAKVNDLRYEIAEAEGANPVDFSVYVHDLDWLRGRRAIRSFFVQEVDRDKLVLAGSALE
jgi:predicted nucleotidyltransferase